MVKHSLSPVPNGNAKRQQQPPPAPHHHQSHQVQGRQQPQQQSSRETNEYALAASSTWFSIGNCALALELEHLALRAFESALRNMPDHVEALAAMSRTLRHSHKQQSLDILLTAFSRHPHINSEPLLWKELAESHITLKQYEQAHQAISRALSIRNNDPELLLVAGHALEYLNPIHAQHIYQTILVLLQQQPSGPPDPQISRDCHYRLALLSISSMNWKTATTELQAAISAALQANPSESETLWCTLASVRERASDLEGALQVCRDGIQVVGLRRKISVMASYLALTPNKAQQVDPEYAISILSPMVINEQNDELDCLAWYLLGKAHSLSNNPRQAYDAYQCALKKAKSSPLPWLAVGALYLSMGQLPDALAAYSQAASLLAEDGSVTSAIASAAAWDGLACVYERCDDQAIDAADAYARAANCYRAADDMRAATQAEQRAHSLQAAARGEAPVPALRPIPETSPTLLREIVMSVLQIGTPVVQEANDTQFHHLPLPKGSLVTRSTSPTEKGTPQWRPQAAPLHVSPSQMPRQSVAPPPPAPPPQQMPYPPMPQQMPPHPMQQQPIHYYPQPGVLWS